MQVRIVTTQLAHSLLPPQRAPSRLMTENRPGRWGEECGKLNYAETVGKFTIVSPICVMGMLKRFCVTEDGRCRLPEVLRFSSPSFLLPLLI